MRTAGMLTHDGGKMAARHWPKLLGRLSPAARLVVAFGSFGSFSCLAGAVMVGAVLVGVILALLGAMMTTVLLAAMLGHRDDHSPFTRLLMLICASTGRRTEDYLVAAAQKD